MDDGFQSVRLPKRTLARVSRIASAVEREYRRNGKALARDGRSKGKLPSVIDVLLGEAVDRFVAEHPGIEVYADGGGEEGR